MGWIISLAFIAFIIFFHELGHFIFARIFGVKVEKFSVGFGKVLVSKKIRDTEYILSAIPFGGYVKMQGESSEAKDIRPDSYTSKTKLKRGIILIAGPLFNAILGFLLVTTSFSIYGTAEIGPPGMDVPVITNEKDIISNSAKYSISLNKAFFHSIGKLAAGEVAPKDALSGPVGLMSMGSKTKNNFGWEGMLILMSIVSFNLAIINLAPIPILDGGGIMILILESIIGKPLNQKLIYNLQVCGLSLLILLMGFTLINDIVRLATN